MKPEERRLGYWNNGFLDVAIIGAPKSGTSSLFYWLDAHPQLQGARPKETFFFMDGEHPLAGRHGAVCGVDGSQAFNRFFAEGANERLRLEGTTHYFYQVTARNYLASLVPRPVICMLVREPAERILSSFLFTRDTLANCDKSLTFDQYVRWLLEGRSEALDKFYRSHESLWIAKRELELSRYVMWLDWWLEKFPRDNITVFVFEELCKDPERMIMMLCEQLVVDSGFYSGFDFERHNVTYRVGNQVLHRLARRVAPWIPDVGLRELLKSSYLRWQRRIAHEDERYEEGLKNLREYFVPWNQALDEHYLLGLRKWWGLSALGLQNGG